MFSRSKAARWRSGERMALRARSARLVSDRSARGGAHPGVLDDGGQVDLVDVGGPVDRRRVEAERGPVVLVHPVPQGEEPVDPVAGVGLGVRAVELDVAEGPVGQQVLLLERGHPRRPACPGWAASPTTRSARYMAFEARCSCRWTRPRPGKDHAGTTMGWPSLVVEGVLGEPRRRPARPAGRSGTGCARPRPRGPRRARCRRRPGRRSRRAGGPRRPPR